MNRVELVGGLQRDPEMRAVGQSGALLTEATLAVSGARFDPEAGEQRVHTVFARVVAWEQVAEQLVEHRQGDVLHVVGELDQRQIEKRDGTRETKTRVHAVTVSLVRAARRDVGNGF